MSVCKEDGHVEDAARHNRARMNQSRFETLEWHIIGAQATS